MTFQELFRDFRDILVIVANVIVAIMATLNVFVPIVGITVVVVAIVVIVIVIDLIVVVPILVDAIVVISTSGRRSDRRIRSRPFCFVFIRLIV